MTWPWFFLPDLDPSRGDMSLPPDEARHLTRVLRLGVGDDIVVFDGSGHAFRARVAAASREMVRVDLLAPLAAAAEPRVPVTLAQGVLKGDRMDHVVRDATMMGARAIVPLLTSRTLMPRRGAQASVDRWTRVAIASAKQCGRAVVPVVADPIDLDAWLAADPASIRLLLVEPSADHAGPGSDLLRDMPGPAAASLLAGPEGGWASDELAAIRAAGCMPLTLGSRTLRADAVPVAALSVLNYLWGDAP